MKRINLNLGIVFIGFRAIFCQHMHCSLLLIYVYIAWFRRYVRVSIVINFISSVQEGPERDIYQRLRNLAGVIKFTRKSHS